MPNATHDLVQTAATEAQSVARCFERLEAALTASGVRAKRLRRSIEFRLRSAVPLVWSFDPGRRGRFFAPTLLRAPSLVVVLNLAELSALVGREAASDAAFAKVDACGDLSALAELHDALAPAFDPIALRTQRSPP
jgi:hypothetical protein